VFAKARTHNQATLAAADLKAWISWARRSRLEPFKTLATTRTYSPPLQPKMQLWRHRSEPVRTVFLARG